MQRANSLLLAFVSGWAALTSIASGQNSADAISTFKSRAELVTIPVVVTDKSGTHLQKLRKEDFIVLEDGKEQRIATFEEIEKPINPVWHSPVEANRFSNVLVGEAAPKRLTIIVLDMINTPFQDQVFARDAMLKYMSESLDVDQPTALLLIRRSGMKVIHDFSSDPHVLMAALKKVTSERQPLDPASQEEGPHIIDSISQLVARLVELERASEQEMESLERQSAALTTLQVMQQIAQACMGLPGRKAMIWASAGFPFSINETSMVLQETGPRLPNVLAMVPFYEKTWKALNQAQIAVYPVDVRGLSNSGLVGVDIRNPEENYYSHAQWQHSDMLSTFQTMAEATGGRAFYNTNDLKGAFQKAADDNASYYMLGYYLERKEKKPGWHKLSVKVRQENARIRARSGFFITTGGPEQVDKTEMQIALSSPLDYTAIPLTAQWQQIKPAKMHGKKSAEFLLTMPANFAVIDENENNHFQFEFTAVARTATGTDAGEMSKTVEGHLRRDSLEQIRDHGMDYHGAIELVPGEYTVHFVVQDKLSGRIGSLAAPLKVTP